MTKLFLQSLSWNGCDKLTKLKESLLPALDNLDLDWQWTIKDNGSKDNTVESIKDWNHSKINVIAYKNNNQNFSEGMNFLFHETSPKDEDFVLLLNNDVLVNDSQSIKNMTDLYNKDKDIGVVGARLLYTNTNKLQHAGVIFHPQLGGPVHFRANELNDIHSEKNRLFQCVTGAVLLTKAKYYKNICTDNKSGISGFRESLVWAFDDIDACLAIRYKMNKKIVYCGNTNFYHEESASLKKNPVNKLFMNHNLNLLKSTWSKYYKMDANDYYKDNKYNLYKIK